MLLIRKTNHKIELYQTRIETELKRGSNRDINSMLKESKSQLNSNHLIYFNNSYKNGKNKSRT